MAKTKKAKPMTVREKKERAEVREALRADGILPPKKKPLNRKKFTERARKEWEKHNGYDMIPYLYWALSEMLISTIIAGPAQLSTAWRRLARRRWYCWLPGAWILKRRKADSRLPPAS